MTLFWHLVRYDLRRFWPLTLAWMVLAVASTAVDGIIPEFARDQRALQALSFAAIVLWLAGALLGAVLIVRAVQSHRLVGTTAFWLTRPIPPSTLLLAKLGWLVAVIVVWPVLCQMALMALHQAPPNDLMAVSLVDLGWRLVVLLALMSAAALTASITTFFVLCASVVVGVSMLAAVYVMVALGRDDNYLSVVVESAGALSAVARMVESPLPDILRVLLTVLALVGLLFVQYRLRSRWRAAALGVAGILIALVVPIVGPPQRVQAASSPPSWAAGVTLAVEPASLRSEPWRGWPDVVDQTIVRGFTGLTGVPAGWVAHGRLLRASLDVGQRRFESDRRPQTQILSDQPYGQGSGAVIRGVLGVKQITDDYQLEAGPTVLFVTRDQDSEAVTSGPANYEGTFAIDLTRVEVASVLPLTSGATFAEGGHRIVLGDIRAANAGVTIGVRYSSVTNMFDRTPAPSYAYYLRNRTRSEAAGATLQGQGVGHMMPFLFGLHLYRSSSIGFYVMPAQLQFRNIAGARHAFADIDTEWAREAELVVLRTQYVGSVERQLRLNGVVIPPRR